MNKDSFTVDIPSWDKYQTKMSRRTRDWIAMSTEMLSDPAIRNLPPAMFKCWVGLLLHAGKVGVPFQFSTSLGKDLFGLRHSPDFSLLTEQGLIALSGHTRHNKTVHNKTVALKRKPEPKNKLPAETKKPFGNWKEPVDGINPKAWLEWANYKRGKPAKATITKTINFLSQFDSETQYQITDQSIRQGWKGLFPLKDNQNGTTRNQASDIDSTRQNLRDEIARLESQDDSEGDASVVATQ